MTARPAAPRFAVNAAYRRVEHTIDEYAVELGEDSVCLRTRSPVDPGTRVRVAFSIHLDGFHLFEADGVVVDTSLCNDSAPGVVPPFCNMIVRFESLGGTHRRILDQILRR